MRKRYLVIVLALTLLFVFAFSSAAFGGGRPLYWGKDAPAVDYLVGDNQVTASWPSANKAELYEVILAKQEPTAGGFYWWSYQKVTIGGTTHTFSDVDDTGTYRIDVIAVKEMKNGGLKYGQIIYSDSFSVN